MGLRIADCGLRIPSPRRHMAALVCVLVSGMMAAWAAPKTVPKSGPSTRASAKDAELARRLLGEEGAADGDFEKAMSLMNDAGKRLSERYDSSDETQRVQARALKALDEAIAQAQRNESQSSSSSRQKGESRKAGRREKTSRTEQKSDTSKPAEGSNTTSGGASAGAPKGSRLSERSELRRGWGFLPQRDREAILQGTNEEFHAKYREHIERYYRAIAERAEQEK